MDVYLVCLKVVSPCTWGTGAALRGSFTATLLLFSPLFYNLDTANTKKYDLEDKKYTKRKKIRSLSLKFVE